MENDVVIGLGANLGDRFATLTQARSQILTLGRIVASSALYETLPVGPPQPEFLNAAVRLETELAPEALLDALLDIERALGRVRRERWGPRTIDLDILWGRGLLLTEPRLVVPHPELEKRAFALLPLLDVAPDAENPSGVSYRAIAATLDLGVLREVFGSRAGWEQVPAR
jgi:2-amino-4-hydroxy-6-hydroxymethyldihydropteridine diphosphokinase